MLLTKPEKLLSPLLFFPRPTFNHCFLQITKETIADHYKAIEKPTATAQGQENALTLLELVKEPADDCL